MRGSLGDRTRRARREGCEDRIPLLAEDADATARAVDRHVALLTDPDAQVGRLLVAHPASLRCRRARACHRHLCVLLLVRENLLGGGRGRRRNGDGGGRVLLEALDLDGRVSDRRVGGGKALVEEVQLLPRLLQLLLGDGNLLGVENERALGLEREDLGIDNCESHDVLIASCLVVP